MGVHFILTMQTQKMTFWNVRRSTCCCFPHDPLRLLPFLCVNPKIPMDTTYSSLSKEFLWPLEPPLPTFAIRSARELTIPESRLQPVINSWYINTKSLVPQIE